MPVPKDPPKRLDIDAVVVSTRRGEVELGWKFGENIVVQPNDV